MTVAGPERHGPRSTRQANGKVVLVAGVLTVANLLAVFLDIGLVLDHYHAHETTNYLVDQDIWGPFIVWAWAQVIVNGLVLVIWRRTRPVGIGVLLGALAAVALFVVWLAAAVAPALE
jgi:hypothetical protein